MVSDVPFREGEIVRLVPLMCEDTSYYKDAKNGVLFEVSRVGRTRSQYEAHRWLVYCSKSGEATPPDCLCCFAYRLEHTGGPWYQVLVAALSL